MLQFYLTCAFLWLFDKQYPQIDINDSMISMIHLYFGKKEYFITVWYAKRCNTCSNSASLSQRLRYKKTTTTTKNNVHVTVQMSLTFVRVVTDYIFLYLIFSLWWWIPCFSSLIMEKTTHNFLKILTVSCQGLGENKKRKWCAKLPKNVVYSEFKFSK